VAIGSGQLALPDEINATCGVAAGPWYRAVILLDPTQSLQAAISAPSTATLGADLDFLVTLTNPTPTPVEFHYCPNYDIGFSYGIKAGSEHQLNCGASEAHPFVIETGASVAFAMRITLPPLSDVAPPGSGDLLWTMGNIAARTPITVVAP
jgi:hypothetical protein